LARIIFLARIVVCRGAHLGAHWRVARIVARAMSLIGANWRAPFYIWRASFQKRLDHF
jgi:hypothetical protein